MRTHPTNPAHRQDFPGPFRVVSVKLHTCYYLVPGSDQEIQVRRLLPRLLGEFATIEEISHLRWRLPDGNGWRRGSFDDSQLVDRIDQPGLLILDRFGDPVPVPVIIAVMERQRARVRAKPLYPGYVFRAGPAPRTWRRRRSGHTLRRPCTTAERRYNQEDWVADHYVPVRGGRRRLPSAWDDIPIASLDERSWKRFRKTQWKPAGKLALNAACDLASDPAGGAQSSR